MQINLFLAQTSFNARTKQSSNQKHQRLAELFSDEGLTLAEIESAAKKFPEMDNNYPETIERNIRGFVSLYEKDGLTIKDHLKIAKFCPSLFASKPETLSQNITDLYDFVKEYGITKADIIKAQQKHKLLRAMSGKTIVRNLTEIPKKYEKYGLSQKEYVDKAFTLPGLLLISPEAFKDKCTAVVKHFAKDGMKTEDYISLFKKQFGIIGLSSQKIIEKLEQWKYIEQNKLFDEGKEANSHELLESILRKNLSHSEECNFFYLLRCKLNSYYDKKIGSKKCKEEITKLLRAKPDKIYNIPILCGKFAQQFENLITEFSNKILGKNAFRIVKITAKKVK